jgi:hypothetical protein
MGLEALPASEVECAPNSGAVLAYVKFVRAERQCRKF